MISLSRLMRGPITCHSLSLAYSVLAYLCISVVRFCSWCRGKNDLFSPPAAAVADDHYDDHGDEG